MLLAVCLAAFTSTVCRAEVVERSDDKPLDGYMGIGALIFPKYAGSAGSQTWPLPLASFEYRDTAYIHIQRAGVRFWSTADKKMALGVAAQARFGFSANDGPRLRGMSTRHDRVEAGPLFEWELPGLSIDAGYFTGWSDEAHGAVAQLSLFRQLLDSVRWDVGAYFALERLNSKSTRYYFGVGFDEATVSRPAYCPGASVNPTVGISGAYKIGNGYAVMFGTSVEALGAPAADSPIVERRSGWTSYLGIGVVF